MIVETEAYMGIDDKALIFTLDEGRAWRSSMESLASPMFFIYGMHHCYYSDRPRHSQAV